MASAAAYFGYRPLVSRILTSISRTDLFWKGSTYNFSKAFALTGAVYKTNDRTSAKDPMSLVMFVDYRFSKRTDA